MRERKERIEMLKYGQWLIDTTPDGIVGKNTIALIEQYVKDIPAIHPYWGSERKLIALIQFSANKQGIEAGKVDGLIGAQTRFAFEQLLYLKKHNKLQETWRDEDKVSPHNLSVGRSINPYDFPKYKDIRKYYGEPTKNLITVEIPYSLRLAWNTKVSVDKITCHKKVANSLTGILEDLRDHYGLEQLTALGIDLYGGCFNHRKMRGGRQLSTHSWGVAIDLDPARNRLRWNHTRAQFAKPSYEFLLAAFAGEGWVSLGEAKDYDWMHFQAVRV